MFKHVLTLLRPTEVVYLLSYLLNYYLVLTRDFTYVLHLSLSCSLLIHHIITVGLLVMIFESPRDYRG